MDELDDIVASFYSVLKSTRNNLLTETFQLSDEARAELLSGVKALSEARAAADENQRLFQKLLAQSRDTAWLDRTLTEWWTNDEQVRIRHDELEAKLLARIADCQQEMQSPSLSPENRAVLKDSIDHTRELLEQSRKSQERFLAYRRNQNEFLRLLNSVNKSPAKLAAASFAEAVTHPWVKGLVNRVQFQQIKVRIQQAVKEKQSLVQEEGLASKLQLVLESAIDATSIAVELLELYRTLKNRDFTHPEDIQALRNIVPYCDRLRDYQSGLRQLLGKSLKELDELRDRLER